MEWIDAAGDKRNLRREGEIERAIPAKGIRVIDPECSCFSKHETDNKFKAFLKYHNQNNLSA